MKMRSAVAVAMAAALGFGLAGCPSNSCPLETPQVNANGIPSSCTAVAGQQVTYPIQICPTCNQTSASCSPDLSAVHAGSGDIFLDTKVEACSGSNSCPPSCQTSPLGCTFTAPAAPGTYNVIVVDGATGQPLPGAQLQVVASGPTSCALPTAGI